MASLNCVTLIGNVGKAPELRSFQNGNRCATFSIATGESWKDKQTGEKKEKVQWHNIAVFEERLVDLVEKYVNKGDKLYIEGQLETRKWTDKDGIDRYSTEVVLRPFTSKIILLGGKENGGAGQQSSYSKKSSGGFGASTSGGFGNEPAHADPESEGFLDDSIPF